MLSGLIVCKFGGTSLGAAETFARVREIVRGDARRRYIVASAPGKRRADDVKITDRLARCHALFATGLPFAGEFARVRETFEEIASALGLAQIGAALDYIEKHVGFGRDWTVSRGEALCARLLAEYLDMPVVASEEVFIFDGGALDIGETHARLRALNARRAVIPGFYGADRYGAIAVFPRGGSDITGAHVASALGAELYENWTDVDGFHAIDPMLAPRAAQIPELSYAQARELCETGAGVLHPDCIPPLEIRGIPIRVRNTFAPEKPGTLIHVNGRCPHARMAVSGEDIFVMGASAENIAALRDIAEVETRGERAILHCGGVIKQCAQRAHEICVG